MRSFLSEDEKTGWNAGFTFHYTEAEPEVLEPAARRTVGKDGIRAGGKHGSKAVAMEGSRAAHYTPSTDRREGGGPNCVVMVPARRGTTGEKNVTDEGKATKPGVINIKHKHLYDEIERREEERMRIKSKNDAFFAKLGNAPIDLKKTVSKSSPLCSLKNKIYGIREQMNEQNTPTRKAHTNPDTKTDKEWAHERPGRSKRRKSEGEGSTQGRTTVKVINCVAITVGEASIQPLPTKPRTKQQIKKVRIDVPQKVEPLKDQNFYSLPVKAVPALPPPPLKKAAPLPLPPSPLPAPVTVEARAKRAASPSPMEKQERRRWSSDVSVTPFHLASDRRNFVTDAMFAGSIYVGERENITDFEKLGVPSCAVEEFTSWRDRFNDKMKS